MQKIASFILLIFEVSKWLMLVDSENITYKQLNIANAITFDSI